MSGSITSGAEVASDLELACDVCVVGSGAGGAVLAAGLAERGLDVVMLEEGSHRTRKDWNALQESISYPMLYQERGTRATADAAIVILQGRSVGGSTTVNWTTSFRTPERILAHWRAAHGLDLTAEALEPHWEAVEKRLNISAWPPEMVNANNDVIRRGCEALGWSYEFLHRNVNGCVNSGYCGLGCPVDGKQAMHLTYLPDAVAAGMRLYADVRADRVEFDGRRVVAVHASVMDRDRDVPRGVSITVRPKVVVVSGGAINSPALLLRSGLDQGGRVGRRTFLHPVVGVFGRFPEPIRGWSGAPQSVASHQFIDRGPGKVGYFVEVLPLQPVLATNGLVGMGPEMAEMMGGLEHLAGVISLSVDGILAEDEGGTVSLRPGGRPRLDYPVGPLLQEAFRDAMKNLARMQLAAGAVEVRTGHLSPVVVRSEADLALLDAAPYGAFEHPIGSAHQMGGCAMGPDPATSVVGRDLRYHGLDNLFVVDGSVLPTALGVNPSETIYGLAHWARDGVAAAV